MTHEKLVISLPIVVEGKYDKIKIDSIADAAVITTGGYGIFNRAETRALIAKLAAARGGIIILSDSDPAGAVIRAAVKEAAGAVPVYNVYTPSVPGREKRKKTASRAGLLGVEGTDADTLRALLAPYAGGGTPARAGLTKLDFYLCGLSGGEGSAAMREKVALAAGLPACMTANALLEALDITVTKTEFEKLVEKCRS